MAEEKQPFLNNPTNPGPQEIPQEQDEMLELLKRGEVRTMQKDIARLREAEVGKEQKRIEDIAPKVPTPPQRPPESPKSPSFAMPPPLAPRPVVVSQKPEEPTVLPVPERRSSSITKFLPKVLIGVVLLSVLGGTAFLGYRLLFKKETPPIADITPPPTPQPPPPEPTPAPPPGPVEPTIPIALFTPDSSAIAKIAEASALLPTLQTFLTQPSQKGITRIVLIDQEKNAAYAIGDLLGTLNIQAPDNIVSALEENTTFFLYESPAGRKRFGFAAKLKPGQNISAALKSWEPGMERDFQLFSSLLGPKNKFYVKYFRSFTYKGIPLRYQTFSDNDLGLVYATIGDLLVFTTSFSSMSAVIDKLTN